LTLCLHAWNIGTYANSTGWNEFYETGAIERKFADCGLGQNATEATKSKIRQVTGWTDNDILMLRNTFMFDYLRFSIQNLSFAESSFANTHYSSIKSVLRDFWPIFINPVVCPMVGIWLAILIFLKGDAVCKRPLLYLGAFSGILMLTVLIVLKLPEWVYIPIFGFNLYNSLHSINRKKLEDLLLINCSITTRIIVAALTGFIFFSVHNNCWVRGQWILSLNHMLKPALASLKTEKDSVYICWADSVPLAFLLPFDDIYSVLKPLNLMTLSFRENLPMMSVTGRAFGITPLNFGRVMTSKNVYFLGYPKLNALLKVYLVEHYGLQTNFQLIRSYFPLRLNTYRIKLVTNSPEERNP
jgi:hypothetical protein